MELDLRVVPLLECDALALAVGLEAEDLAAFDVLAFFVVAADASPGDSASAKAIAQMATGTADLISTPDFLPRCCGAGADTCRLDRDCGTGLAGNPSGMTH
ncbi:MAG: hypothetical protein ABI564_17100 [Ideonella sp.]